MTNHLQLILGKDEPDSFRHPMWKAPADDADLPAHIRAARTKIAALLVPYDGRPNSEYATDFFLHAWVDSNGQVWQNDPLGFIGALWWICEQHANRLGSSIHRKDILRMLTLKLTREILRHYDPSATG